MVTKISPTAIGLGHPCGGTGVSCHGQGGREQPLLILAEQLFNLVNLLRWVAILPFVVHATEIRKKNGNASVFW